LATAPVSDRPAEQESDERARLLPGRPARVRRPAAEHRRVLHLSDAALIDRIREGDERAFEQLYDRHAAALYAYCMRMLHSRDDAEDAVQQVLLNAFKSLTHDTTAIELRPWLFRIAHNHCVSVWRRRHEVATDDVDAVSAAEDPEHSFETRRVALDALHDLSFLPEQQRTALLLASIQKLPHEEIAQILGCPTAKVKSLVFRASRALAERRLARETSCAEIRRRLGVLKGGSLRQNVVRWHLAECEGCRDYREQIKRSASSSEPLAAPSP
jgi:RNA polymerase sigma factor (sigma-70 family)